MNCTETNSGQGGRAKLYEASLGQKMDLFYSAVCWS